MTSSAGQQGGEPLQIEGGPLGQLLFRWEGDRYHHKWLSESGESLMHSIETNDSWPASPPLQQIHQQSFPDGREVIFGVGMSGRGHWSASFTLVPDLQCWIVELACRSPVAPEVLGSTYEMAPQWKQADTSLICDLNGCSFSCEPIAPALMSFDTSGSKTNIAPSAIPSEATTVQWAFRLRAS
ncbi:MAG: hypothetical protein Aurels2KO_12970 [Aureliella sp.]